MTSAHTSRVQGLVLRNFQGEQDFPQMAEVLVASEKADQVDRQVTPAALAAAYHNLAGCDPYQDMVLAEVEGKVVGYARGAVREQTSSGRPYSLSGFLAPQWRRRGIGSAMLAWVEERMQVAAASRPDELHRFYQVSVTRFQEGTARMLEKAGYQPVRYFFEMVRPTLEDIQDLPLPSGLELRPALQEHYQAIWQSVDETSQDEWESTPLTEEDYQAWLANPHFQPHLWQVAWDTARGLVAGHVLTFINEAENEQFGRKRGYTEGIGVDRTWRRRGVARALIARSLQAQKAAGMTESALVADSDSTSGVVRLYESCGFQVTNRSTIYRKPLP